VEHDTLHCYRKLAFDHLVAPYVQKIGNRGGESPFKIEEKKLLVAILRPDEWVEDKKD
jgi:hypothetical protein